MTVGCRRLSEMLPFYMTLYMTLYMTIVTVFKMLISLAYVVG